MEDRWFPLNLRRDAEATRVFFEHSKKMRWKQITIENMHKLMQMIVDELREGSQIHEVG